MDVSVRVRVLGLVAVAIALSSLGAPARAQTLFALGETAYLDFSGSMPGAAYTAPGADEVYLHVSIERRELSVRRGSRVLHTFPVAVGKGAYLRHRDAENGGWLFETPAGVFSVGRKEENPVWYAPDWHFIEKGRPVPPANSPLRYFPGDMGNTRSTWGTGWRSMGRGIRAPSVRPSATAACVCPRWRSRRCIRWWRWARKSSSRPDGR